MADPMSVGGVGTPKIDETKWKKLTPTEIIREEGNGEEIPAEIIAWAQIMAAYANMPDDVTYESVGGDTGLNALLKLGIEPALGVEGNNAIVPDKPLEPGAVRDVPINNKPGDDNPPTNPFLAPPPATDTPPADETDNDNPPGDVDLTLADNSITTNDEEIRRRNARKGRQ